jgi:putative ABC transport system substrate-binding protein
LRRREFITLLGGATAWPLAAPAQRRERMRSIGVLLPAAADDAEFQVRAEAFLQGLALLGSTIGRNVRIDAVVEAACRLAPESTQEPPLSASTAS